MRQRRVGAHGHRRGRRREPGGRGRQGGDLLARCSRRPSRARRGILLNITGGSDLGLFEVNEAAEIIGGARRPRRQHHLRRRDRRRARRPGARHRHRHRLRPPLERAPGRRLRRRQQAARGRVPAPPEGSGGGHRRVPGPGGRPARDPVVPPRGIAPQPFSHRGRARLRHTSKEVARALGPGPRRPRRLRRLERRVALRRLVVAGGAEPARVVRAVGAHCTQGYRPSQRDKIST